MKIEWKIERPGYVVMPYAVKLVEEKIKSSSSPLHRIIDGDFDVCVFSQPDGTWKAIVC